MVVIFDMNTGEINEQETSQPVSDEHSSNPIQECETAARLQEVEITATNTEQSPPPLLHHENAESFLNLMEAKPKQSR